MKFTLSWLKEHLDTDANLEEVCERLTAIGLEVEDVDDRALTSLRHRQGYLRRKAPVCRPAEVLMVDTGDGKPVQVVCGAPNARAVSSVRWRVPAPMCPASM